MSTIALVAPLFVLPLAGCAAIRSDPIDISTGVSPPGVEYSAPKGLLRVQLFEQDSVLALEISEPIIVGDPNASYVVNGSAGLLANQEYRLVVEPQTRLLTYINSRSEGQAGTILQNLARSAAGLGEATRDENNFGPGPRRIVYQRVVDPFDYPDCDFGSSCTFGPLAADLRRAALAYLGCERANRREAAPCPELQDANFFAISLTPLFRVAPPSREGRQGLASDCRRSICYRAPAPYALSLRVGAHTDISEIVSFPNEAPVIGLDIPAGVFADANARVELFQGMPARYVVDRENELVAITLLPMDVLKAGFSAVSEVLQLRVNYNTARINMIQSDRRLANERSADAPPPGEGLIGDAAGPRDENGGASPAAATSDGEAPWSDDFLALSVEDVTTRGSALPAESLFSIALDGRAPNGGADQAARPAHGADLNDDD
ncbi:MAG: hypothetical protein R3C27_15475 [Hyphomonadaceae bacterium]